jgi:hypothetical protein
MPDNFILPKKDVAATRALRSNHFFSHPQSYITFADDVGICHFVLEGADRSGARHLACRRAKEKCEAVRHVPTCSGRADEMDHERGGNSGRCDCYAHGRKRGNLRMLSHECHTAKHGRVPRFGESS